MFFLLLFLLSCSGSRASSSHKVIRGSAGTVFPDGSPIRTMVISPEATFNNIGLKSEVEIESDDLSDTESEFMTKFLGSFYAYLNLSGYFISELLRINNNGSIFTINESQINDLTNESDYTKWTITNSDNIKTGLVVKQVGNINEEPYFTLGLELTPEDGYKITAVGDKPEAIDINSSIGGASKIVITPSINYVLKDLDDINNVNIDNSLRPQSNKVEDNFLLKDIVAITKDLKVKKISSDELSDIKDIMIEAIKEIITKPIYIDEESSEESNIILPSILLTSKIERFYMDKSAFSMIEDGDIEDIVDINHLQLSFNNRSFHKIIIIADSSFKVNNGSLVPSSDSDSYTLLECSFTSDIVE